MDKVRLGDVCKIVSGSTPKTNNEEYWNGNLCWITPAEISDSNYIISDTIRKITIEGAKSCSLTCMPIGTVLLTSRAPIGKVAITGVKMYCNQGFKNLICSERIYNKYLYWYLKNNTEHLNLLGRGATFKEISKKIVAEIKIPLPDIEEQKKTANKIDMIESLIEKNKKQFDLLDELIKSRFVEMFGDIKTNSKGFDRLCGKDLFAFSSGKFLPRDRRLEKGIPVYGGNGVAWYTETELIDYSTIIIGRVGAWCGNIHRTQEPVWITDNAIYIKQIKSIRFNLLYLEKLMLAMNFMQYADYSGQPKITQKPLEKALYIVPPIDLQNQFADFVTKVEQQKSTVQKSIEKLEILKKSLMQEYFG